MWPDFDLEQAITDKARTEPGYAIAYALIQVAEALDQLSPANDGTAWRQKLRDSRRAKKKGKG
jgi:hypothetical protein